MTYTYLAELTEKGRDLTQSYDKSPEEMSKGQSDKTNNATNKFDYTAVADRFNGQFPKISPGPLNYMTRRVILLRT